MFKLVDIFWTPSLGAIERIIHYLFGPGHCIGLKPTDINKFHLSSLDFSPIIFDKIIRLGQPTPPIRPGPKFTCLFLFIVPYVCTNYPLQNELFQSNTLNF